MKVIIFGYITIDLSSAQMVIKFGRQRYDIGKMVNGHRRVWQGFGRGLDRAWSAIHTLEYSTTMSPLKLCTNSLADARNCLY